MRKDLKASAIIYPQPVLIVGSYDEFGVADAMNAAWGGVADYNRVALYLAAHHKTVKNILINKEFSVSIADRKHVVEADYVGIVSANNVPNKLDIASLHTVKSQYINAPIIEEFPLTLECKFVSFDEESELMYGDVVNVSVDESILDDEGKIDVKKLDPITYDPVHHAYYTLGEKVGNAFSDGKKIKG